jgi:nitrogen fixation NifU-like protein
MKLDELYQEIILDHWKHPRGRGLREPYGAESHQVNPTCGDEITLRVRLDEQGHTDLSYEGEGCSISQASASVLYELVQGRPLAEAMRVQQSFAELMAGRGQVEPDEEVLGDGIAFAGVARYPARVKCALLAWMAFKDAASRAMGTVDLDGGNGSGGTA